MDLNVVKLGLLVSVGLALATSPARGQHGIEMSRGLTIKQVADDDLVPDCTTIAVDSSSGRVFASGPGYIRMLVDRNGDGVYEDAERVVDGPDRGAHGLLPLGTRLYFVGDDGVWRVELDSKGQVASEPTRMLAIKTGGEHDAHAIRLGPDKHWYLIAGNATKGMFDLQNDSAAVIPHPRAGAIWRISPDFSKRHVWAHGFRNAYDFDFAPGHAIDTFDSDGERDVSLPWYRPTRVYRVQKGDDAGWMTRSWKRPNIDPQMPQVLAELGRGSPTGVMRYRHHRLPARFHHGVFVLDWTFGRIWFIGDEGTTEQVASPSGTTGFAVTDIDALPDGRLLVSVGGRRSRGGVYLIDAIQPGQPRGPRAVWADQEPPADGDEIRSWITKLRDQTDRTINHDAARRAVEILRDSSATDHDLIGAITLLIESVGGLGQGDSKDARGETQVAAVFDSYRSILRPKLDKQLLQTASVELIRIIKSASSDSPTEQALITEAIRGLAVIEPDSKDAFVTIANDMDRVESPVDKLHRLIALARIPVRRSDDMTERVARAMLAIPEQISSSGLNVDRNWTPRMGELFVAMEYRDSLLPSRLVSQPTFGHQSHLVWTERMDPENLERARHWCLTQASGQAIDPAVARFIALGDDAVPPGVIRRWLQHPLTRPAAWLAIASHPRMSDVDELRRAALSVDKTIREAAQRALKRLGVEVPERESNAQSVQLWMERVEAVLQLEGDADRGKEMFSLRQCAACHNGAKALGPSLEGIQKRFSGQDLFRATIDPSHTVSDRYRGRQVLTTDGEVVVGMAIYESVDGVTLLTADAKTRRINSSQIESLTVMSKSLMPEGLVDGLADSQVADLIAYMRSL